MDIKLKHSSNDPDYERIEGMRKYLKKLLGKYFNNSRNYYTTYLWNWYHFYFFWRFK
jgi:hypothetical protein